MENAAVFVLVPMGVTFAILAGLDIALLMKELDWWRKMDEGEEEKDKGTR